MDCERAELLIHHYQLGLPDADPGANLDRHLDACYECCAKLSAYGEGIARLARSVPQIQAPVRVRQALLARIDRGGHQKASPYVQVWRLAAVWSAIKGASVSRKGATTLFVAASLLLGGIWINQDQDAGSSGAAVDSPQLANLSGSDHPSESLALERPGHMETATAVAELVNARQHSAYGSVGVKRLPGISVSKLQGTIKATGARGVLIASDGRAMLLALNLPPLPRDKVYQIWLVKAGIVFNAGLFTVDATGYGQTVIIPYLSLAEYDGIGITIEPAKGSLDPTGVSVLQGDL